jgi:hypothetical protein
MTLRHRLILENGLIVLFLILLCAGVQALVFMLDVSTGVAGALSGACILLVLVSAGAGVTTIRDSVRQLHTKNRLKEKDDVRIPEHVSKSVQRLEDLDFEKTGEVMIWLPNSEAYDQRYVFLNSNRTVVAHITGVKQEYPDDVCDVYFLTVWDEKRFVATACLSVASIYSGVNRIWTTDDFVIHKESISRRETFQAHSQRVKEMSEQFGKPIQFESTAHVLDVYDSLFREASFQRRLVRTFEIGILSAFVGTFLVMFMVIILIDKLIIS